MNKINDSINIKTYVDKPFAKINDKLHYKVSIKNSSDKTLNNILIKDTNSELSILDIENMKLNNKPIMGHLSLGVNLNTLNPNEEIIFEYDNIIKGLSRSKKLNNEIELNYTYIDNFFNQLNSSLKSNPVSTIIAQPLFKNNIDQNITIDNNNDSVLKFKIKLKNIGNAYANNVILKNSNPMSFNIIKNSIKINSNFISENNADENIYIGTIKPNDELLITYDAYINDSINYLKNQIELEYEYSLDSSSSIKEFEYSNIVEFDLLYSKISNVNINFNKNYIIPDKTFTCRISMKNTGTLDIEKLYINKILPNGLKIISNSINSNIKHTSLLENNSFLLENIKSNSDINISFLFKVDKDYKDTITVDTNITYKSIGKKKSNKLKSISIDTFQLKNINPILNLISKTNNVNGLVGDIINVEFIIENKGNCPLKDINLTQVIPDNLKYVGNLSINKEPSTDDLTHFVKIDFLDISQYVVFNFDVKILNKKDKNNASGNILINYNLPLNISDNIQEFKDFKNFDINIIKPNILVSKTLDKQMVEIDDIFTYNFNITNKNNIDLENIEVNIRLADNLDLIEFIVDDIYVDKILFDRILPGESKDFYVKCKVINTSEFIINKNNIMINYDLILDNEDRKIDYNLDDSISIFVRTPKLDVNFEYDTFHVTYLDEISCKAIIKNIGDIDLIDLNLKNFIPDNFEFVGDTFIVDGFIEYEYKNNNTINIPILKQSKDIFLEFKMKLIDDSKDTLYNNIITEYSCIFQNQKNTKTETLKTNYFKVKYPQLELNIVKDKESYDIDDTIKYVLSLKNTGDLCIDNLSIQLKNPTSTSISYNSIVCSTNTIDIKDNLLIIGSLNLDETLYIKFDENVLYSEDDLFIKNIFNLNYTCCLDGENQTKMFDKSILDKVKLNYFKESIIELDEYIDMPISEFNIVDILSETRILNSYIIKSIDSITSESFYKLLIKGFLDQTFTYTKNDSEEEFNYDFSIPFSVDVVLPHAISRDKSIRIESSINDIYYKKTKSKTLFENIKLSIKLNLLRKIV